MDKICRAVINCPNIFINDRFDFWEKIGGQKVAILLIYLWINKIIGGKSENVWTLNEFTAKTPVLNYWLQSCDI